MKRALFALFCACSVAHPSVEIAAPLASASVAPMHDEVAVPPGAKRVVFQDDGSWVADFPRAKTFAVYDLPEARRALLTWRVGISRVVKRVDGDDEDYPANHVAPIDLVVRAKGETRTVAFGELSGSVEPYGLSWCGKDDTARRPRAFASTFSIGLMQGDDEMVIVRDARTLHVLHRETSDGHCDEKMQGPLDVCDGFEWQRVAEVRMPADWARTELWEIVESEGKPLACDAE